ncbi:MAG: Beta-galactosidase [Parcubacteria group bacterium ADurb.Bin216]|nr:MAG: Beta-galactosidase [Parcubacteria group bacterium ADurb.Bin216]
MITRLFNLVISSFQFDIFCYTGYMEPLLKYIIIFIITAILILCIYLFVGESSPKKTSWGINYSTKQAVFLGLEPKEVYISLLEDLRFKDIKISVHWDLLQPVGTDEYDFTELDWQIEKAKEYDAKVVLAIGMKTPRWPECHMPQWARNMDKRSQQESIIKMLTAIVDRYKDDKAVSAWQVENEPFLRFGACPWIDGNFLKQEVALVKALDPSREVIVTDSGEMSLWLRVGSIGDVVGVTTYRKVWQQNFGIYIDYFLPPIYYQRRAEIINWLYGKKVIGTELQAEPWCKNSIINTSQEEQAKTLDLEQFKKNIEFAKRMGFGKFYLWGGEWWYWQKEVNNRPEIWEEVKKIVEEDNNQ